MEQNHEYKPIRVYSTFNQTELLIVKGVLDLEGIPYETKNEIFASLFPGANGLATIDILVDKTDAERAGEILGPFIKKGS